MTNELSFSSGQLKEIIFSLKGLQTGFGAYAASFSVGIEGLLLKLTYCHVLSRHALGQHYYDYYYPDMY